jgi:hypothetical protein
MPECPLLGVQRTLIGGGRMSACSQQETFLITSTASLREPRGLGPQLGFDHRVPLEAVAERQIRSIAIARRQHAPRLDPFCRRLNLPRHDSPHVRSLASEHRLAQMLRPHSK